MADNIDKYIKERQSFVTEESEGVRGLWSSFTPFKGGRDKSEEGKEKEKDYVKQVKANASILNNINEQNLNLWKAVGGASTYSGGQSTVDAMQSLKAGDEIFFFDFENLGSFFRKGKKKDKSAMGFYSPTELAMQRVKINSDMTLGYNSNDYLSLILGPSQNEAKELSGLVSKLEAMQKGRWSGLTDDEWRTANDLILYSDSANFETKNGLAFIKGQNRKAMAMGAPGRRSPFEAKHVSLMKQGLKNLQEVGKTNTADKIAESLIRYFGGTSGNIKLGGHNIQEFDTPMLLDWMENGLGSQIQDPNIRKSLNQLKANIETQGKYIDTYRALDMGYKDKSRRFKLGLKLESLAKMFGLNKGTSHLGIDDVHTNIAVFNKLVKNHKLMDVFQGAHPASAITYNQTNIKKGTEFFSVHGLASFEVGKHDNIFAKNKDGKFVPAYNSTEQLNPFAKNSHYSVHQTFHQEMSDGKKHYGIIMKNEETGLFHMFARESKQDLENLIHKKMVPYEQSGLYRGLSQNMSNTDRARRRWDKMFDYESGGGRVLVDKMLKLHRVQQKHHEAGKRGEALKKAVLGDTEELYDKTNKRFLITPEMYRDYDLFKDRFAAEADHLQEFVTMLDEAYPRKKSKKGSGTPGTHNIALKAYADILNQELGENRSDFDQPVGRRHLEIQLEGSSSPKNIDLTDASSISRGMNRIVQHKSQPLRVIKHRLQTILGEARSQGMSSKQAEKYRMAIQNLESKDRAYQLMEELGFAIHETAQAKQGLYGRPTINLSDPTKVSRGSQGLEAMSDAEFRHGVFKRAMNRAEEFSGRPWEGEGYDRIAVKDPLLKSIFSSHNKAMDSLAQHTGIAGSNLNYAKAEDTLTSLINSFTAQAERKIQARLLYDGNTDSLQLVLANEKTANQVFGLAPNEILEQARQGKVAQVTLPMLDGSGNTIMNGQVRTGRLKVFERKYGKGDKFIAGTAFEHVVYGLMGRANRAGQMLEDGSALQVSSMLNAAARESMQTYTMNNLYHSDPSDAFRQDTRMSKTAQYSRRGHVDLTQLAEGWYQWMYNQDGNKAEYQKSMERKRKQLESNRGLTFFQTLTKSEMRAFQMSIDQYTGAQFGFRSNVHNVNDRNTANGLRSTADIRHLLAFGYLDPMARENIVKHGNYLPLDRDDVVRQLKDKGVSDSRINRMLRRGLTTDTAEKVLKGETAFISLRTALMNDYELAERMKASQMAPDQLASTYEGGVIVREDVAEAFTTTREKKVRLSEGAVVPQSLMEFFRGNVGGLFEEDGKGGFIRKGGMSENVLLSKHVARNEEVGSKAHGKLTVGVIAKDDATEKMKDFLKGHYDNAYIKGLKIDEDGNQQLIVETREFMRSGIKLGSDAGDRVTAIVRSKEWFRQMGLEDAEAISPYFSGSRDMHGAETRDVVSHIVDVVQEAAEEGKIDENTLNQAYKSIGEKKAVTVGSLTKSQIQEEAMGIIARIMESSFSLEDKVNFNKDAIVMKDIFGIESQSFNITSKSLEVIKENVENAFNLDPGNKLIDLRKGGVKWGQRGFTVADVWNWEDQIGYVKGRESGNVRWGYKETSMIESRARRVFKGEKNAVTDWLSTHVQAVAEKQGVDTDKYLAGIYRTITDAVDKDVQKGRLRKGDVVVRTYGDSFDPDDSAGATTGRVRDGVTEVSMHAFEDTPTKTHMDEKFTVGRYARTIIAAGSVEVDINGKKQSLQNALDANDGTFLFQMPKGFSRDYVRMVDQKLVGLDDAVLSGEDEGRTPMLQKLQKSQLKLWRTVKAYTEEGRGVDDANFNAAQQALNEYEDAVTHIAGSARDGSAADLSGAKMDMAGRFRSQGVNPFVKGGDIEEGEVVVGKEHFKRMIAGAEEDILQAVNPKAYEAELRERQADYKRYLRGETDEHRIKENKAFVERQHRARLQQKVLDYAGENGLYGIVNRYPTIEKDTMQVLKVKWSDKIHGDTGVMNAATALTMNADYDGDFWSAVLAHYKPEGKGAPSAQDIHRDLGAVHEHDKAILDEIRASLESDLRKSGMEEVELAKLTVQDIVRKEQEGQINLRQFTSKVGKFYDIESIIARTGKADVGVLDNLRYRLFDIAKPAYEILGKERGLSTDIVDRRVSHMEEFGRMISQNSISSKKFKYHSIESTMLQEDDWKNVNTGSEEFQTEIERRMTSGRYGALDELVQGIRLGNHEGADMIRRANDVLGIFKTNPEEIHATNNLDMSEPDDVRQLAGNIKNRQRHQLDEMLDTMVYTNRLVGSRGWVDNLFGQVAVSEGPRTIEKMADVLLGRGGMYTPTPAMKSIERIANHTDFGERSLEKVAEAVERGERIYGNNILTNYDHMESNLSNIFSKVTKGGTESDTMLSTATAAEEAGVKLRQVMGKMTGGMSAGAFQGAGWGAGMFGALWAASAVARSGPTPEGLQEQTNNEQFQTVNMTQPTARVQAQNTGEHINLRINAKDAKGMTQEEISAMVQSELGAMTSTQMNMNLSVNDNTQNIDQHWLQGVVANAIDKGFGF